MDPEAALELIAAGSEETGDSSGADVTNSCLALAWKPSSKLMSLGSASLPLNHSSAVKLGSSPIAGG